MKDGILYQYEGASTNSLLATIKDVDISTKNIIIYDSTNTKIPIYVGDLNIDLNTIAVQTFPAFNITVDSVNLNTSKGKITLKNLDFKTQKDPTPFFSGLTYRKAWMDFSSEEIEIDFRFEDLLSLRPKIEKIKLNNAHYNTIINLGIELSSKEKLYPNRILANMKFPFTIDSVLVTNSQLDVNFLDNGKTGLLQFNDVDASISNITSDKEQVKKNNEMIWVFKSTLWDSGKTKAKVNYKLDTENDAFTMYGEIDDLIMPNADTLTSDLYGIRVKDGSLQHTYFYFEGDVDEALGLVKFDYESLHLGVAKKKKNIKKEDDLKKVKKKDKLNQSFVTSMIVNGLISKRNLPKNGNYIVQGTAYYEREYKNRPIFQLMWYTIASGILEVTEAGIIRYGKNFASMFNKKVKSEKKEINEIKKEIEHKEIKVE
jgi:hypothetical protein